ncbi:lactoylglutathione lyase [Advenella kashmirensis W13003]|uniref:Lactoylglutathione lyase n=1 Tax=Advenella kashmirensis W13003 TaxID=1424334 RepID=V8QXU6_9BURK|nr:VOC family protein [Advenella kashmirensis]ETF04467.1 lactoylglutathione lyase [Advenella kashmirensis W13003]
MMSGEFRLPYGSDKRYHLHHPHIICSDIDVTLDFYQRWFDAEVKWDGLYAGTRNVFLKIGIGAMHLYEKKIDATPRNAIHHIGIQVAGLEDLYQRMRAAGVLIRNPIRQSDGGGYFMLEAPDHVLLELFEPGPLRSAEVLAYYGYK